MSKSAALMLFATLGAPGLAAAAAAVDCPAAVRTAAQAAHPSAKVTSCKKEVEKGKTQYEVKLEAPGQKLELDISPEGSLLLTEEVVALDTLPKAVRAAFDAKNPQVKPARAEKQTQADGTVNYELAFKDAQGKRHEQTFKDDGTFIEEE